MRSYGFARLRESLRILAKATRGMTIDAIVDVRARNPARDRGSMARSYSFAIVVRSANSMRDRPMRESTLKWLHLALKRWQWGPAPGDAPGDSWLRAIRVALGMTSRQLAARLGVSEPAVRGTGCSR
jgi:hypothetical protein